MICTAGSHQVASQRCLISKSKLTLQRSLWNPWLRILCTRWRCETRAACLPMVKVCCMFAPAVDSSNTKHRACVPDLSEGDALSSRAPAPPLPGFPAFLERAQAVIRVVLLFSSTSSVFRNKVVVFPGLLTCTQYVRALVCVRVACMFANALFETCCAALIGLRTGPLKLC